MFNDDIDVTLLLYLVHSYLWSWADAVIFSSFVDCADLAPARGPPQAEKPPKQGGAPSNTYTVILRHQKFKNNRSRFTVNGWKVYRFGPIKPLPSWHNNQHARNIYGNTCYSTLITKPDKSHMISVNKGVIIQWKFIEKIVYCKVTQEIQKYQEG